MAQISNDDNSHKKTIKRINPIVFICILFLVVIIVLASILVIVLSKANTTENTTTEVSSSRGVLVTQDNVEELIKEVEKPNTDEAYTVSMNIDWYFPDGKSPSKNAYVENHVSNSRTVYFDVILAETAEIVYASPYIPLGSTLKDFSLDKELAAGDYNAIVEYHLVDDDYKELSTVSVTVTLHIQN